MISCNPYSLDLKWNEDDVHCESAVLISQYVHKYLYIYVYINIYIYTSIFIYIYPKNIIYIYTYTSIYIYIYTYIYIYIYTYIYTYIYICVYIYVYIYMCVAQCLVVSPPPKMVMVLICIWVYTNYRSMCIYMYICIYVSYICIYIYIYRYRYTDTYTYTYIRRPRPTARGRAPINICFFGFTHISMYDWKLTPNPQTIPSFKELLAGGSKACPSSSSRGRPLSEVSCWITRCCKSRKCSVSNLRTGQGPEKYVGRPRVKKWRSWWFFQRFQWIFWGKRDHVKWFASLNKRCKSAKKDCGSILVEVTTFDRWL